MKLKSLKLLLISALFSLPFSALAEMVNINDASAAAMSHYLKGIGTVKATSIVKFREANGDFKNIDDLVNVKGIGKGILKKNRDDLSLNEGVVKWMKSKPKLVTLSAKKPSKNTAKKRVSKKLASKTVEKGSSSKIKEQALVDLKLTPKTSKKKDVLSLVK